MRRLSPVVLGLLLVVVLAIPLCAQLGAQEGLDGSVVLVAPDGEQLLFRATLSLAQSATMLFSEDNLRTTTEWDTLEENVLGDTAYFFGTRYVDSNENSLGLDVTTTLHLWESENYCVVDYKLVSTLETDLVLYCSMEIVPTLEGAGEYGGETADVNSAEGIAYIYEGERYLGVHFATRSLTSYRAPDYDDFETAEDPDLYRYDQMSSIENSELPFTSDYGLLPIANSGRATVPAGDSIHVALVWGYGADAATMTANILAGRAAYDAVSVAETHATQPLTISLAPVYPNPFNAGTVIRYSLPTNATANLMVVDLLGRRVATLAAGTLPAGEHRIGWNPEQLASGSYFLVLESGAQRVTQRMILLR